VKKLECLKRIFELSPETLGMIIDFFVGALLIEDTPNYKISPNKPEYVYKILQLIEKKVQMISFEWQVLPKEYIIISVTTDKEYKEFTYGN